MWGALWVAPPTCCVGRDAATLPFGRDIELPEPVGITLQTEQLKDWVR